MGSTWTCNLFAQQLKEAVVLRKSTASFCCGSGRDHKMVKVSVLYCGGGGYTSKFNSFKEELIKRLDGAVADLEIEGVRANGTTGEFEITVNGELVHSKKNGDKFVDDDDKFAKIIAAVKK